jgi:hypothetical protein
LLGLALLLAGCAAQLAPIYDQALVSGLTSTNADTLELMAAAADGTTKESFPSREPQYNKIIGKLDALALQAAARPVPRNNVPKAVKEIVGSRNTPGSPNQIIPSSTALQEISNPCLTVEPVFSTILPSSCLKNLMISTKVAGIFFVVP